MNTYLAALAGLILFVTVLACDSRPWSRFIVVNETNEEITVAFYTPHPQMASPYFYSKDEFENDAHWSSGNFPEKFTVDEVNSAIEVRLASGEAVEIDRAPQDGLDKDIEGNFLIDRLVVTYKGEATEVKGRKNVFNRFKKETYWSLTRPPRYVIYFKPGLDLSE